ncbi:MAG: bifunctional glutamate N-acetyltransferase/amino-acid acetyltransferase ArgJ [Candidatus Micrarchaeota archaeon]|nr:bifunctional glutamate N-acetyltransferase/amino-acid acetyltransferase ArgJ [Candidatus Micrarchaeota archaeon]
MNINTNEGIEAIPGFTSLGKHVGIKPNNTNDFAVLFCEKQCNTAAVYTQNNVKGAPLYVTKEHLKSGVAQAIVVTSGNANVGTGQNGIKDAETICVEVAKQLEISSNSVLIASTGVIGKPLPMQNILPNIADSGIKSLLSTKSNFAEAIMTTDTRKKQICVYGNNFKIAGVAKGSGMIYPNMATTLCFIVTDAEVETSTLQTLLRASVDKSFNMINVDMDTSTSDMAILMANGIAGKANKEEFAKALDVVCLELAKMVASDGEGATKLIEAKITSAKTQSDARKAAKSIVNSNLFKAAVFGSDPNWGRALSAIGNSGIEFDINKITIAINNVTVLQNGLPTPIDEVELSKKIAGSTTLNVDVDLGNGTETATAYGCDLSYEYISINSEYRLKKTNYVEKAEILLEAFNYAKKFSGKIMVVKYGGNAMVDKQCKEWFFEDVAILRQLGVNIVIVHGGGPFLDVEMKKAGIEKKTVNGLRITDSATLEIAKKVFNSINQECVASLANNGVKAFNATAGLIETKLKNPGLGFVGEITHVNTKQLVEKMHKGNVPVVSSLGTTLEDQCTNVNADTIASNLAIALQAEKLTILTNVDGVSINGKVMTHLTIDEANQFSENGQITAGMLPKIAACIDAVKHNVKKAHLINGTKKHALLVELFTPEGIGTELVKNGA